MRVLLCPKCNGQVQRLDKHSFCLDCDWDDLPPIQSDTLRKVEPSDRSQITRFSRIQARDDRISECEIGRIDNLSTAGNIDELPVLGLVEAIPILEDLLRQANEALHVGDYPRVSHCMRNVCAYCESRRITQLPDDLQGAFERIMHQMNACASQQAYEAYEALIGVQLSTLSPNESE